MRPSIRFNRLLLTGIVRRGGLVVDAGGAGRTSRACGPELNRGS